MGASDEAAKERCMKICKEKRKVKRCIYQNKKEVNKQFGRKKNQDVDLNRKLFWWEGVSKVNGGKENSCCKLKDGNRRLALGEDET